MSMNKMCKLMWVSQRRGIAKIFNE